MDNFKADFKTTAVADARSHTHSFRFPARIAGTGLALGVLVDWLFYGKPLGISLLLFVVCVVGALVWNGRHENVTPVRRNLWLLLPLGFLAAMVFVRANAFLTTLNVLAVLSLLAYLLFFYAAGRVEGLSLLGHLLLPLQVGGLSLSEAAPIVADSVDVTSLRQRGRRNLFPLLRGGLLALPVLIIFTLLLTSADLIFADYVENVFSLAIFDKLVESAWRLTLIVLVAWVLTGGLALALHRRDDAIEDDRDSLEQALAQLPRTVSLGFIESGTILTLVNLLFLAFVSVQFTYLFGGEGNINLEGYTYAEYARRGFFELLTVAVLTLSLILGLNWLTRRQNKGQIRLFNGLSTLTIGFVLVMLVSAFRRMSLYEATFGYTELRLMVYVFMVWLAGLLLWFVLMLWRRPDRFALGAMAAALGFLISLNLINPDAFIARQNLARYQATGDLDAVYLATLSVDAMPQQLRALTLTAGDETEQANAACSRYRIPEPDVREDDCYDTPHEIIETALNGRYQTMTAETNWQRWQSFHLARRLAYRLLESAGMTASVMK